METAARGNGKSVVIRPEELSMLLNGLDLKILRTINHELYQRLGLGNACTVQADFSSPRKVQSQAKKISQKLI